MNIEREQVEELLHLSDEYSVSEVEITLDCYIVNKTLAQLQLTKKNILVLAIKSKEGVILTPTGKDIIKAGDRLIVYGRIKDIAEIIKCNIK